MAVNAPRLPVNVSVSEASWRRMRATYRRNGERFALVNYRNTKERKHAGCVVALRRWAVGGRL